MALDVLCDSLILSPACRERFLPLADAVGAPLRALGVQMAGLSTLSRGYHAARVQARYHVVLATVAGAAQVASQGRVFNLGPGTIAVLPAAISYGYSPMVDGWEIVWFHLARRSRWRALEADLPMVVDSCETMHLARLAACYADEAPRGSGGAGEPLARALAKTLPRLLPSDQSSDRETEERMRVVLRAVEADLCRRWTERELAALAHYSPQHFRRLAARHWGIAPLRAVARARMDHAAALLEHTSLPVAEIATAVGYDDPYAFSTAFRRVRGVAPRNFRRGERPGG